MAKDEKKPKDVTVAAKDILSKESKAKNPKPSKKESTKRSKTRFKHTHIEHHYDETGKPAGHTVRHTPMGGGEEVSYAAPDMDGVHDGLEQNVGDANAGEAAEPAEAPAPAATPAAPMNA